MNETSDIPLVVDKELYPALIQCFFIISAGYIAGQLNLLTNSHSIGLSRYISNFALPAIIFKNLVNVQFQSVSWQFLTSVLISKTILFFLTMILTYIAERPRNFASMGQYAIITTQSNDFALILPIIDAVYQQSHPEYGRYVYLIAPISLIILNPIGFFFIEMQKSLDEQRRHRGKSCRPFQLISIVFRNIFCNPIVICTVLGIIFNQIFQQKLPYTIEYVLNPIAQSFTSTALFYLGLTMVGKLNRLHAHLVITVFLLCLMKLIIFPLILRQAIFFLVKPINGSWNNTIDYSNLGFLYGTAPTAPSVIFYVPESNLFLQAISSTELVVSTLLSGPIILVSAKMINLHTLDIKIRELYELLLTKTAFDVSIVSFLCTIIVLIGFCVRHRRLKTSFIDQYTFIFVGLQMILSIWTIATHYIKYPLSLNSSVLFNLGGIFIALTTRTWVTSLSIALMITICYSNQLASRYSWIYHVYGWIVPICVSLIIYFCSSISQSKEISILGAEKFGKIQIILSIVLLGLCILINTINLLRIARRTYRLRHNPRLNEGRSLINDDEQEEEGESVVQSAPQGN
jgi:predicted permease